MQFLSPYSFWLLLFIPIFIFVYVRAQRRRNQTALQFASARTAAQILTKGPGRRRHLPAIFFLIGLAITIVALARPSAVVTLPSTEVTVILTIDVSRSMRQVDMKPSRIEAAKQAARNFVEKQPPTIEIGVVSFSDYAAVVQFPTRDRDLVNAAINRLNLQGGTAIGRGILVSLDTIDEALAGETMILNSLPTPGVTPLPGPTPTPMPKGAFAPAIIILLTDGANRSGPLPVEVAGTAAKRGVRVYTIGVGKTGGAPSGGGNGGGGFGFSSALDETTLKKIAEVTDAAYYNAGSETELEKIYETISAKPVLKTDRTELTAILTGAAAAFFLMAGFLSLAWFGRFP
ncbi:MAG: VWA domain-containing protein [Chloroflexi bacterium]|nr:VWA domain-containing protein [Chloroflexota bacterium]